MTLVWRPGFQFDTDASTYIEAVEAVDTQALETATRYAINDFVIGCKQDGIWSAIKASCILAGARTLAGALVPLVGTAPTNFNFVAGDYARKTGLAGDASTKYLDSNRNSNADPQNSYHLSTFPTTTNTVGTDRVYIGAGINETGTSAIWTRVSDVAIRFRSVTATTGLAIPAANNLVGASRSSSSQFTYRRNGSSETISTNSDGRINANIAVFASGLWSGGVPGAYANARLAFYSIGESLDLALLDARVTALITAFGVAIP
jgi:hypothetical protein